jgi:hypothetical protein
VAGISLAACPEFNHTQSALPTLAGGTYPATSLQITSLGDIPKHFRVAFGKQNAM